MSLVNKVISFARSPQGRRLIAKASNYAQTPEGRRRIAELREQVAARGAHKRVR